MLYHMLKQLIDLEEGMIFHSFTSASASPFTCPSLACFSTFLCVEAHGSTQNMFCFCENTEKISAKMFQQQLNCRAQTFQGNTRDGCEDYRQDAPPQQEFTTYFQILRDIFFLVVFEIVAMSDLCQKFKQVPSFNSMLKRSVSRGVLHVHQKI